MYQAVIVDDNPLMIEDIRNSIDWAAHDFEICFSSVNPLEVLTYLEHNPADLMITDISMPQMNGLELIERVRKINPLTTVLVLSAKKDFESVRSAMRQGAENYLLKPLNPEELAESVGQIAAHIHERSLVYDAYGCNMLSYRSLFVEGWLKASLSREDFIYRARILGINLEMDNYTVVCFSAPPDAMPGKENMSRLFDYLLSFFLGHFICHFCFESPSNLTCILCSVDGSRLSEEFIARMEHARMILKMPFFTAVGSTVDNYRDVAVSYQNASECLFLQYTPIRGILFEEMILPLSLHGIIEQDYSELNEAAYLTQLDRLMNSVPVRQRISCLLNILKFGFQQASAGRMPSENLADILGKLFFYQDDLPLMLQYIHEYVHICCEIYTDKKEYPSASYPAVDAVINAIRESPDKDISLKTLAARMNIHPSYLGSIFHQQTGYYFNDYLNEERLKQAVALIETTDLKLKDIVGRVGFSSQTYFNRQFKSRYGMTPNVYRRELRMKTLTSPRSGSAFRTPSKST